MKKKTLQGLALTAAGAVTASSILNPISVSVIAEETPSDSDVVENSDVEVQSDTTKEPGEGVGEKAITPTLEDLNVLASVSMATVEIGGKVYVKDAPTLSLATACSLEGVSIQNVSLRGVDGGEIYSYAGGNTSDISIPQITEEETQGKSVAECLSLVFTMSDGTELTTTLNNYVSNLSMSGFIIDSDAPVIDTNISFDGNSKEYDGTTYYTSNGKFTVSASDDKSGIDIDRWEVSGVDGFEVSSDGNSVAFSSDTLGELNNVVTVFL